MAQKRESNLMFKLGQGNFFRQSQLSELVSFQKSKIFLLWATAKCKVLYLMQKKQFPSFKLSADDGDHVISHVLVSIEKVE